MLTATRRRVARSSHAVAAVFRNRALRRIELARVIVMTGVTGSTVVFVVLAYRLAGASGVAILAVVRTAGNAVAAPFGSLLGDRYPRHLVMAAADALRAVCFVISAAAATTSSVALVIVLGGVASLIGTASAPARSAIIPAVATNPEELTAANVVAEVSDNLSSFVGPAVAGVMLHVFDARVTLVAAAVTSAGSALLVAGLGAFAGAAAEPRMERVSRFEFVSGFRVLVRDRSVRLIVGMYSMQTLATGVTAVAIVSAAATILSLGDSGVGYLYAAAAVGGVLGSIGSLGIEGRRFGFWLATAFLLSTAPIAAVGAWPRAGLAIVLVGFAGLADGVTNVLGLTVLQRRIPNDVFARAIGASGTILLTLGALGNALAPLLLHLIGVRLTLVVAGGIVSAVAVVWWSRLTRLTVAPSHALELVRSAAILGDLPPAVQERLAAGAAELNVADRETMFREGDPADRLYVIANGAVAIVREGTTVAQLGPGDVFGEIGLLRDVPRTAAAVAVEPAAVYAIHGSDFVEAVVADGTARAASEELIGTRLTR